MQGFTPRTTRWIDIDSEERGFKLVGQWYGPIPKIHLEAISSVIQDDREQINLWLDRVLPKKNKDMLGFPYVETIRFSNEVSDSIILQWLHDRGVRYQMPVYVFMCDHSQRVLLMPWRLLVKYWEAFERHSSYALLVTDRDCQWACMFHHEEVIQFGSYAPMSR